MKHYRETIIKQVINSPDELSVEQLIDNRIQILIKNGTHVIFILRIVDKLLTALGEMKRGQLSEIERRNIIQAMNILNDYDNKLSGKVIKVLR